MTTKKPPPEVVKAAKEDDMPVEYYHGVWLAAEQAELDPSQTLKSVRHLTGALIP